MVLLEAGLKSLRGGDRYYGCGYGRDVFRTCSHSNHLQSGVERVLTSFSVGEKQAKRLTYFSVVYGRVSVIFGLQAFLVRLSPRA